MPLTRPVPVAAAATGVVIDPPEFDVGIVPVVAAVFYFFFFLLSSFSLSVVVVSLEIGVTVAADFLS